MGQQQLLLVILVTIIVGIATVVAINVFGTSAASANEDAVRQDILTIAASAQGWYIKPEMMDGGGNSFVNMTFRDISFPAEGINAGGDIAWNMNGTYQLSGAIDGTTTAPSEVTITADPSACEGYDEGSVNQCAAGVQPETMEATILPSDLDWSS